MEREWLTQQKKDLQQSLERQEKKKENLIREIERIKEDNSRKSRNSTRRSPMKELNSVDRLEQSFESYYQMHSLK